MSFEHLKCVILDATYTPVDVMPVKDAFTLLAKDRATVIETHPDVFVRTVKIAYDAPKQILLNYVVKKKTKVYNTTAQLNKRNLLLRDDFSCQYCGRHESELSKKEKMTRDHVFPRVKGGSDTWLNVVVACSSCNHKKADYLLEDVDMELLSKPYAPTVYEIMARGAKNGKFKNYFMP